MFKNRCPTTRFSLNTTNQPPTDENWLELFILCLNRCLLHLSVNLPLDLNRIRIKRRKKNEKRTNETHAYSHSLNVSRDLNQTKLIAEAHKIVHTCFKTRNATLSNTRNRILLRFCRFYAGLTFLRHLP